MANPRAEGDYGSYLAGNLSLIRGVIRQVARRHRLTVEDEAEFTSVVFLKLISDDYAVLRQYRGESGLTSYLVVVITRSLFDWRDSRWGKWRPSAQARRIGAAAVALERLIDRDGLPAREAFSVVAHEPRWGLSTESARQMYEQLPIRMQRPRAVAVCEVPTPHPSDRADRHVDESQVAHRVSKARSALRQAMAELSREDRRILALRFKAGRSVAAIARLSGLDQRVLYRRLHHLLRHVRASLEAHEVTRADIFELVGHSAGAIDSVLGESAMGSVGHV
jgi:RNA polymerase sigma factor (sigma-70 family)